MPTETPIVTGRMSITGKGIGYVKNPEFTEDIEVQTQFLNTALHGDEVEVTLHAKVEGMRQGGEVLRIISRAKMGFVGVIDQENGATFLVPDDKKMYVDIVIPAGKTMDAKNGEKAYVVITKWDDSKKSPEGEVRQILGHKGDNDVEMLSIVLEKGFDTDFPDEVVAEAHEIEQNERVIPADEIAKRRDMRGTFTSTIDPEDAKDFDDALSLKELPNGNYEVGIHIADVSHYVREGSELDKEALKRGCSIYLVDRTIPMLPHVLSNDVCSLNPHEDKLTFSAVFEMTAQGEVVSRWFGRTVINSDKRFTYEEAQVIMTGDTSYLEGSPLLASFNLESASTLYKPSLLIMKELAEKLRKEKFENGAIDFETTEVKFRLDAKGKPIEVYKKERFDAHKLVEDFMLLANREVAKFIITEHEKKGEAPLGIYRNHDLPAKDRLDDLSIFLKALGFDLDLKKEVSPKDIQRIISEAAGDPNEQLIKTATIRSMAKAVYGTANIGHFGLAFKYYTHFTSPIRRYPDLLVHRIVQDTLDGKKTDDRKANFYIKAAKQSSDREVSASDAERASIKYKQVEYMVNHIGKEFNGIITGVTEWGIYVEEEETKCEGMVKLRDLNDDFYTLDQKNYTVTGTQTGKKYRLGDKARIKVLGADMEKRMIDYMFV
jgi:ribonuclease R